MATGGQKENGCSLIEVKGVTLKIPYKYPWYRGIVVCRNMIFVIGSYHNPFNPFNTWIVQLHGLQDGKLLYKPVILESPRGICVINDAEIAVILERGVIQIMSIDSTLNTRVITWTRNLRVQGGLGEYHGVVSFKDDLVVCGVKQNMMCWCIVSSNDGHVVGTINQICKVKSTESSSLTTKDNIVYISCDVQSIDTGVYAYDVQNPSKYKYRYKHKDLKDPSGIVIDQHGCLFVCNSKPYDCIHHLTSECQLVSIITGGILSLPSAIFWDNGHLYLTCFFSNSITTYRTQYPVSTSPEPTSSQNTSTSIAAVPSTQPTEIQVLTNNTSTPTTRVLSTQTTDVQVPTIEDSTPITRSPSTQTTDTQVPTIKASTPINMSPSTHTTDTQVPTIQDSTSITMSPSTQTTDTQVPTMNDSTSITMSPSTQTTDTQVPTIKDSTSIPRSPLTQTTDTQVPTMNDSTSITRSPSIQTTFNQVPTIKDSTSITKSPSNQTTYTQVPTIKDSTSIPRSPSTRTIETQISTVKDSTPLAISPSTHTTDTQVPTIKASSAAAESTKASKTKESKLCYLL